MIKNAIVKYSLQMDFQKGYFYIYPYKKVKRMLIAKNVFITLNFANPMVLMTFKKHVCITEIE